MRRIFLRRTTGKLKSQNHVNCVFLASTPLYERRDGKTCCWGCWGLYSWRAAPCKNLVHIVRRLYLPRSFSTSRATFARECLFELFRRITSDLFTMRYAEYTKHTDNVLPTTSGGRRGWVGGTHNESSSSHKHNTRSLLPLTICSWFLSCACM